MKVCAKRRGLIREIRRGEKVEWLNFNRFGIAFSCLTRLDIQEKIILDIHTSQCKLKGLVAVVHNARRTSGKYRYGVQFCFGANSYMGSADIREALATLETDLN